MLGVSMPDPLNTPGQALWETRAIKVGLPQKLILGVQILGVLLLASKSCLLISLFNPKIRMREKRLEIWDFHSTFQPTGWWPEWTMATWSKFPEVLSKREFQVRLWNAL